MNLKKRLLCDGWLFLKLYHWHSYASFCNYGNGKKWRECEDCGKELG